MKLQIYGLLLDILEGEALNKHRTNERFLIIIMKLYWVQLNRPRSMVYLIGSLCLIGSFILLCQHCGITLCPLRRYTGIPCFTCGSTRAIVSLISGDLKTAFLTQPLIVSLVCLLAPILFLNIGAALLQKRIILISFSFTEKIFLCLLLVTATLLNWLYLLYMNHSSL